VSRLTIAARVTRGMVLASLITALTLASAAAAMTYWLWQAREETALAATADALAAAVHREMQEEKTPPEKAAPEALRESSGAGYHIDVWQGGRRLATNASGGPEEPAHPVHLSAGWLVADRPIGEGVHIVVQAPAHRVEALRVFGWSLLLATPLCLCVALLIGRVVGRRATLPLVEFKGRIAAARPFEPLRGGEIPDAPSTTPRPSTVARSGTAKSMPSSAAARSTSRTGPGTKPRRSAIAADREPGVGPLASSTAPASVMVRLELRVSASTSSVR